MSDKDTTEEGVHSLAASERLAGFRDYLVLVLPVAAFGAMFGAASSAAGHSIWESLWGSALIFAGASQFVFLNVYEQGVPVWSILLTVFAVNFRHILYSAAVSDKLMHFGFWQKLGGYFLLTDLQFAVVEKRFDAFNGKRRISPWYYFTFGLACYLTWVLATGLGALSGALIKDPALIGLDFILPIYFLTILMGFRTRSRFLPIVLTSGVVAVVVDQNLGSPWHISIGALAGIAVAVVLRLMKPPEKVEKVSPSEVSND